MAVPDARGRQDLVDQVRDPGSQKLGDPNRFYLDPDVVWVPHVLQEDGYPPVIPLKHHVQSLAVHCK